MNRRNIFSTMEIIAVILFAADQATAQSYVGIDLYVLQSPPGTSFDFPTGFPSIAAGGQVVGHPIGGPVGGGGGGEAAFLWTPPSGVVVDLAPPAGGAVLYGTDGTHQVGTGGGPTTVGTHALLWSGTAASAWICTPRI